MIEKDSNFTENTKALYKGERLKSNDLKPEALPLYATTAFNQWTLSDVRKAYNTNDYTYMRTNNPNRDALAETVNYLEGGEESLILTAGMAAITTSFLTVLKKGDHLLCNADIYGETLNVVQDILPKLGIETSTISFMDTDKVRAAMKPNTKLLHTEVVSNPTIRLTDIPTIAKIAYEGGALLMVDNTFTTAENIKPISLGADIVINSMTKFMNGHSDAIGGSVTSTKDIIKDIDSTARLMGTSGDPFDSWLILRGMRTIGLRVPKQAENAAKLAKALEDDPHVTKVNHPSLDSNPQHELAKKLFKDDNHMTGMLSFQVAEDLDKIDEFMKRLNFAHYAMTLGGFRTSLSHPVTSSHNHVPDDIRRSMGITPGLMRVSVGIEDADDLIADFKQALKAFD